MDCEYTHQLKNLDHLMEDFIDCRKKIVNTKISRLIAPGENNCSVMLKMDLTLKNEENDLEELNIVAKISVDDDIGLRTYGDSFKYEINFYNDIVPVLLKFQNDYGVEVIDDLFPKLLASRLNLHGQNEEVDVHTVVIFENLNTKGFETLDRMSGFDLATTKLIIKDLAAFHAVPIALKCLNPELFQKKLLPHLGDKPRVPPSKEYEEKHRELDIIILEILEKYQELEISLNVLTKSLCGAKTIHKTGSSGIFSTIAHGDMWVNNIMIKFENGLPIKNKFIDYQDFALRSLLTDLYFFLMTSVQIPVLENKLDDLIQFYYKHFIENLNKFGCDIIKFSWEQFLEDLNKTAKEEFKHTLKFIFLVVCGKRGGMFNGEAPPKGILKLRKEDFTKEAEERGVYVVKECATRGWI